MIDSGKRRRSAITVVFLLALFAISITPVRSYDYFWHLATGRWILDHGKLPTTDPFTLASEPTRWVDGEWLFQIGAAVVDQVSGSTGTSLARALSVAMIFSLGLAAMLRRSDEVSAMFVAALSAWGADHRLTTRPETIATLFLALALWMLFERKPDRRTTGLYAVLTIVWMAHHPSALLAPAIAGLVLAGRFVEGERGRQLAMRLGLCVGSGFALLVNPWGLEGVLAPLRLASIVSAGSFVNTEWTATRVADFPVVFLVVIGGLVLFGAGGKWREETARLLVFAFVSVLAIRYVRNHGFFFAAIPFAFAPLLPSEAKRGGVRAITTLATALLLVGLLWKHGGVRTGVDETQFPVASVSHLARLGLEGNIYNPDQLGGYLIWRFYPERRVLTDGRNELHLSYIEEYGKARLDQRAWNALLEKYGIVLAVDEYRRETMDVVNAVTGETTKMPASLIYFPRQQWALVGFDDVAMVFARRDAYDPGMIEDLEFRMLVPDGVVPLTDVSREAGPAARAEIRRARDLFGEQKSIRRIEMMLGVSHGDPGNENGRDEKPR
jgi:hypothetical protein